MVLTSQPSYSALLCKLIVSLSFLMFASACSHIGTPSNSNSSPTKPVIPVVEANTSEALAPQTKKSPKQTINKNLTEETLTPTPKHQSSEQHAPTDVLGSVISSAKKAISLQQWLRAQRHLEHALRIAPKDAEIYYIYADVYEGLGVQEQVVNMLKRAKFLANPSSDIYHLSSEKLETLNQ